MPLGPSPTCAALYLVTLPHVCLLQCSSSLTSSCAPCQLDQRPCMPPPPPPLTHRFTRRRAPHFTHPPTGSREFSLSWQFYGTSSGGGGTPAVHWGLDDATPAMSAATPGAKFGCYWLSGGDNGGAAVVVGGFLEGGTPAEFDALKTAVTRRVPATADDLEKQGIAWALTVAGTAAAL